MKTTLTTLIIFILTAFACAEDYPSDARIVIEKLDDFEAKEKAKLEAQIEKLRYEFEKKIEQKKTDVAKYLKPILDRETRNGNLETANLIKDKITELTYVEPVRIERYEVVFEILSWEDARRMARRKGGKLAIPSSPQEQAEIIAKINGQRVWIGAELKGGKWPAFDGAWRPSRPSANAAEKWAALGPDGWVNLPDKAGSTAGYVIDFKED